MTWLRENPSLGRLLIVFGVCVLGATWFFFSAKADFEDVSTRFANTATELNRLERLSPYPSAENLRQTKAHAEDYASALAKLKEELKMRVAPVAPMAPNEFQSHLRVATSAVADKARANRVRLPERFFLGFDQFASALPSESAAPLLGQELVQIEWLLNSLLDARVESVSAFRRALLRDERGGTKATNLVERNVVEVTFVSTPAAARK